MMAVRFLCCLWILLWTCLTSCRSQADVKNSSLNIMIMISTSERFNSSNAVGAVNLAMKHIDADESLLEGLKLLAANVTDSKCDESTSAREFLTQVQFSNPNFIGVIGCGCSVATESVADIVSLYGLPLISYTQDVLTGGSAPSMSGHFQLYPSERNLILALLAMVKKFGWNQLSLLTQNEKPYIKIEEMVIQEFARTNITILPPSRFSTHEDIAGNQRLFVNESHVNLINCFENKAIQILCIASKSSMKYPNYAWILYGWYSEEWWRSISDVNCTENEIATVLERALVIQQYHPTNNSSTLAIGGLSREEYFSMYSPKIKTVPQFVETLAYDSVWTLALALNRTMNMINTNNTLDCGTSSLPLEQFSYSNSSTACLIRHSLRKTNFTGLSGSVEFDEFGVRKQTSLILLQYRNDSVGLKPHQVATLNANTKQNSTFMYLVSENTSTVWPDGIPPDGSTITIISVFHIAPVVIMYAFGAFGILFCIICLIFNVLFRKRRIVRLTSPNLNYCIIAGALLMYGSAFIRLPFTNDLLVWDIFCKIESIMNCIGYSFMFGPILAKMWRIYYIFHNPSPQKKNITDWHLGIVVAIVVAIVLVLLVVGYCIPATIPRAFTSPDGENRDRRNEIGILQTFRVINCYPPLSMVWVLSLYIYLGILQVAALVLAVRSRNVKIKVLNDSKEVALIVYITTIVAVETAILGSVLQDYNNISESLFTGHLLVGTSAVVGLVFVPKMISLCRDPKGEKVFSTNESTENDTFSSRIDRTKIVSLEQEIMSLKQQLKNKGGPGISDEQNSST